MKLSLFINHKWNERGGKWKGESKGTTLREKTIEFTFILILSVPLLRKKTLLASWWKWKHVVQFFFQCQETEKDEGPEGVSLEGKRFSWQLQETGSGSPSSVAGGSPRLCSYLAWPNGSMNCNLSPRVWKFARYPPPLPLFSLLFFFGPEVFRRSHAKNGNATTRTTPLIKSGHH